jgi:lipopolysaccharide/colanic/teichoic acid biosynthesis glycosyltransferase
MYRYVKRLMDITLSSLALLVLSPLLVPVCVGLLLTGEHHVFYSQERIGYRNRRFGIWKFATMLKNSPNMSGGLHTTRRDPRVLPMGHFLRKTKINELPQLINILIGDMSIVGPRPLVDKTFDPYPDHVKKAIYHVRPGLTGIGSIVFRDEERLLSECGMPVARFYAEYIAPAKGELELWYQNHLSFRTDVMLIVLTAWVIIFPQSRILHSVFGDLPAIRVPGLRWKPGETGTSGSEHRPR